MHRTFSPTFRSSMLSISTSNGLSFHRPRGSWRRMDVEDGDVYLPWHVCYYICYMMCIPSLRFWTRSRTALVLDVRCACRSFLRTLYKKRYKCSPSVQDRVTLPTGDMPYDDLPCQCACTTRQRKNQARTISKRKRVLYDQLHPLPLPWQVPSSLLVTSKEERIMIKKLSSERDTTNAKATCILH